MGGRSHHKHRVKKGWNETCATFSSIMGGLTAVASLVVPWRYTPTGPSEISSFWPGQRKYTLLSLTDKQEGKVTWSAMKQKVCRTSIEMFTSVNTLQGVGKAAAATFASGAAGKSVQVDCSSWISCRNHVGIRCNQYRTLAATSVCSAGLIAAGGLLGFATAGLLKIEEVASPKKKSRKAVKKMGKKIHFARMRTMAASIVATFCVLVPSAAWIFLTGNFFKAINLTAYYPDGQIYAGFGMGVMASMLLCCSCCITTFRYEPAFCPCCPSPDEEAKPPDMADEDEEDWEEDWEDDYDVNHGKGGRMGSPRY